VPSRRPSAGHERAAPLYSDAILQYRNGAAGKPRDDSSVADGAAAPRGRRSGVLSGAVSQPTRRPLNPTLGRTAAAALARGAARAAER
jgi:hypothetical protein